MVPARGVGLVAESHPGEYVFIDVPPRVARNKKAVLLVEDMIQFKIQIVKIESALA